MFALEFRRKTRVEINKSFPKTRLGILKGNMETTLSIKRSGGRWNLEGVIAAMWNQMVKCVRRVAKRCLESLKGKTL